MTKDIKVMLADHHSIFREGLRRLLDEQDDMQCVAEAKSSEEVLKLAKQANPDVLLIDIAMPPMDSVAVINEVKEALPSLRVVVLSHEKCDRCIVSSMQSGVDGYIMKDTEAKDLLSAIRIVYSGEAVFDVKATGSVLRSVKGLNIYAELRERELEVISLVAKGMTNKQISNMLNISERTVSAHLFNIFRKLGVASRTEAVLYAVNRGWITYNQSSGTQPPR